MFRSIILSLILSALSLTAASRAYVQDGELILGNEQAEIAFRASDLMLLSIHSTAHDFNVISLPGHSPFSVQLGHVPGNTYASDQLTTVTATQFRDFQYETIRSEGAAVLKLHYKGAPIADTGDSIDVSVELTLPDDSPVVEWRLNLNNRSNWALNEIRFPTIRGLGFDQKPTKAEDEYIALPLFSGVKSFDPRHQLVTNQGLSNYPGGGLTVQMLAYCNARNQTFYFAAGDAENYTKTFFCEPMDGETFHIVNLHYADQPAAPGYYALPYPMYTATIAGDWYDAAKIYRAWTLQFPRWKPLYQRDDIPEWYRQLIFWGTGHLHFLPDEERAEKGIEWANLKVAEKVLTIQKRLEGLPMGFHWYIWMKHLRHDYQYPDFFPAADGFAKGVKKLQDNGVTVMPYMNILLCDTFLPIWEQGGKEAASINILGELNRDVGAGMWKAGDPRFLTGMCFGTTFWQDRIVKEYTRMLTEVGTRMVYLDQLHNFPARCYAKNHQHLMQGGNYIAEGERAIARRIRDVRRGDLAITGEGIGECYIDVVDGLLSGHVNMHPDFIPLFQSIYSDRTTEWGIQCTPFDAGKPDVFRAKQMMALVNARQLGWVGWEVIDMSLPGGDEQVRDLATCGHARQEGLDFLFYGEMLRTPEALDLPTVTQEWGDWGLGKKTFTLPAVMSRIYRHHDGYLGLVCGNITEEPQKFAFQWNERDWGIPVGQEVQCEIYREGRWEEPQQIAISELFTIEIAPRDAILVRFRPLEKK